MPIYYSEKVRLMRRTKIVATLGPASADKAVIRQLVETGTDIFRLNFSHGTREKHRQTIHAVREICREVGRDVAILQDLCGPKTRVGEVAGGMVSLTVYGFEDKPLSKGRGLAFADALVVSLTKANPQPAKAK